MANRYKVDDGSSSIIMAAIEIGNSHSCYSFSFCHDPYDIQVKYKWTESHSHRTYYGKAPLAVLFDEKKVFHSFGYFAEDKYAELSEDNEHFSWYFFRELKTFWHGKRITSNIEIDDIEGKKMKAIDVFGAIIGFLKEDLCGHFKDDPMIDIEKDISWILTVPDSWPSDAHLFMKEAAYKAGIDEKQLSIITESVAAITFCQRFPKSEMCGTSEAESFVDSQENKFVVINARHDDTHISVYKKNEDDGLMALHNASDGPWGVACVEEEFYSMLSRIIGFSVHQILLDCDKFDVLDFKRSLIEKCMVTAFEHEKVTIVNSFSIIEKCENFMKQNITEATKRSSYNKKVSWLGKRVRIDLEFFKTFFKPGAEKIVAHIQDLISKQDILGRSTILLVGELSESPIFQDIIQKALPNGKFIIPSSPSEAVCRGAVLFGRKPIPVASYFSKNSYGSVDESVTETLIYTFHSGITPLLFH